MKTRQTVPVLGSSIDATSWDTALSRIATWAAGRESRYVCICNVHSVVTSAGVKKQLGVSTGSAKCCNRFASPDAIRWFGVNDGSPRCFAKLVRHKNIGFHCADLSRWWFVVAYSCPNYRRI